MTWTRHRTKAARQCDRCRLPASWNLTRKGYRAEYLCEIHAHDTARSYGLDSPPAVDFR